MDWHVIFGLASGALQLTVTVPYLRDMIRGTTRPNIVSWFIWDLSVGISLAAQLSAGPTWSLAVVASAFIMDTTILAAALAGYGYRKFSWWDGACLVFSLSAIILWQLTSNPLVGLALALLADFVAYIPTFVKSYKEPESESPNVWGMLVIVSILGIIATSQFNFANLAFPMYYGLINLCLWSLITIRSRLKGPKNQA